MDLKVTGKCFVKQESGLVIDVVGNNLLAKSVIFCKMTPFVITEEGNIDILIGGKMEVVYQADGQLFGFYKGQVKELQAERSQSIVTSVLWALMGSRYKTRRQVTGILPMPVTAGSITPATAADAQTTTVPPAQVKTAP